MNSIANSGKPKDMNIATSLINSLSSALKGANGRAFFFTAIAPLGTYLFELEKDGIYRVSGESPGATEWMNQLILEGTQIEGLKFGAKEQNP